MCAVASPVTKFGRAGSAGGKAYSHFACRAGESVRHVRRALLVAYQNVLDVFAVENGVINGQNGSAGIAEYVADSLLSQTLQHDLRS